MNQPPATAGRPPKASPKKMFTELANTHTLFWVVVALLVHVVLIGATSVDYIRDHWLGRKPADAAAVEAPKPEAKGEAKVQQPIKATTPATADVTAKAARGPATKALSPADTTADERRLLEQRRNTPEVKRITEPGKSNEIPKEPGRTGFDLDDSLK